MQEISEAISGYSENSICAQFGRKIWTKFRRAVRDYRLIEKGDSIAVCISGGKDSMLLAACVLRLLRNNEIPFRAEFIAIDPGYAPGHREKIAENCALMGIPVRFFSADIFKAAENSPKNPCFLCSRLRRGTLCKTAAELGCNKIALGHHFDDVIETTLMGMLYGSQMQTMLPRLRAKNYPVQIIRPLCLVREEDIIAWADFNRLSFGKCACPVAAVRAKNSKRAEIKQLLVQLRSTNPAVDMNIFRSAENVDVNRLVSYHDGDRYYNFLDKFGDKNTDE